VHLIQSTSPLQRELAGKEQAGRQRARAHACWRLDIQTRKKLCASFKASCKFCKAHRERLSKTLTVCLYTCTHATRILSNSMQPERESPLNIDSTTSEREIMMLIHIDCSVQSPSFQLKEHMLPETSLAACSLIYVFLEPSSFILSCSTQSKMPQRLDERRLLMLCFLADSPGRKVLTK